jgi:uncharacterized membrane protein
VCVGLKLCYPHFEMVEQCKLCKNVYRNRLYNFLIVADVFDWFTDRRGVRFWKTNRI